MDPGPLQRVRRGLDWLTERVRNDVADLGLEAPATNNGGQQRRAPNPPMKRRRTKSSVSATIRSIREGTWGVSSPNNANDIDLENQGGGRPGSSSSSASRQRRPSSNANGADDNDAAANEDNIEIEPVPPPIPWHTPLPTDPPSMRVSPKCRLMRLPPEVQLQVFRHLSFGDLERMRRTSVYYRSFLRPAVVQFLHGGESGLRSAILSHCCRCLVHDPEKKVILMADRSSPDWPLSARCLDCAAQAGEMKVGTKVMLGNFTQAWVCRWCGYPIRGTASYHHAQFHRECYNSYNDVLLGFFVLGWIQLSIGIVAAALAWRYFRGVVMVFAPTVVSAMSSHYERIVRPPATLTVCHLPTDILHTAVVLYSDAAAARKCCADLPLDTGPRVDHCLPVDSTRLHARKHYPSRPGKCAADHRCDTELLLSEHVSPAPAPSRTHALISRD